MSTFYCSSPRCEKRWVNFKARFAVCPECGLAATKIKRYAPGALPKIQLSPDLPEHYNVTTGCVIRSRRHLTELQKRNGWQDYEKGVQKPSGGWQHRHADAVREQERMASTGARRPDVEPDGPPIVVGS